MKIFRPKILYEKGVIPRLATRFSVSEQTVRSALRFATEGEQPDLIRAIAIKEYGCMISKKPMAKSIDHLNKDIISAKNQR